MKKLLILFPACILFNLMPAFAQDANIVEAAIQDFKLQELGIRFVINLAAVFILVHLIYFARHKNKDFQFTLILFNCVNFLICFLLSGADLEVGFAFGLFAIFSIMRYRTVTVPVKEMGYLFICVALGLINSLAPVHGNFTLLICANSFIILLPLLLDRTPISNGNTPPQFRDIIYERIDLIKPERMNEMIDDLRNRTGLPIQKVDIVSIDLMQDVAVIKAHYYNDENQIIEAQFASKENANPVKLVANNA